MWTCWNAGSANRERSHSSPDAVRAESDAWCTLRGSYGPQYLPYGAVVHGGGGPAVQEALGAAEGHLHCLQAGTQWWWSQTQGQFAAHVTGVSALCDTDKLMVGAPNKGGPRLKGSM